RGYADEIKPRSSLARTQLVEDVAADRLHPLEPLGPARTHVIGVVVRRAADLGEERLAAQHLFGDARGDFPWLRLGDAQRLALTGEGELATQMAVTILIDDAADR